MHREDRNNVACSGVTRPNRIIMGVRSHREVDKLVGRGFLDPPEHLVGRLVAVDRIWVTAEVDVARHSGRHVIQRRGGALCSGVLPLSDQGRSNARRAISAFIASRVYRGPLAGRLPLASNRMTLISPIAISSIEKMPSLFSVPGLSCFGGG